MEKKSDTSMYRTLNNLNAAMDNYSLLSFTLLLHILSVSLTIDYLIHLNNCYSFSICLISNDDLLTL